MYDNLLEKLLHIANKNKNDLDIAPNNNKTKYDNIINSYIKDLEYKIIIMKNTYLYTLIRKHYCNDEIIKRKILIQGNIPQKRNNVKKCFNELIFFIKNNLQENEEDQKYYYMLIITILNKYSNISNEDVQMAKKLYNENRLNILNEVEENFNTYENKNKENVWIKQKKSGKKKIFKLFTIAIPLIYIATYFYTNIVSL